MPLPELDPTAMPTLSGLHRGALLLKAVQYLTQSPLPAYLDLALHVAPAGLVSGTLPAGGRVWLDVAAGHLVYAPAAAAATSVALHGRSQAVVFADLFSALARHDLSGRLPAGDDIESRVMAALATAGRPSAPPPRPQLLDESIITIDSQVARSYSQALDLIFTGLARFRAHLRGTMTPIVLWPHHFDLSMLWFLGHAIDDYQPHLNFGFAPFSAGIEHPYLYAYAYPYPDRYDPPTLPTGAHWHTAGWTGVVLPYPVIAAQPNPINFIETTCQAIYDALLPLLASPKGA